MQIGMTVDEARVDQPIWRDGFAREPFLESPYSFSQSPFIKLHEIGRAAAKMIFESMREMGDVGELQFCGDFFDAIAFDQEHDGIHQP